MNRSTDTEEKPDWGTLRADIAKTVQGHNLTDRGAGMCGCDITVLSPEAWADHIAELVEELLWRYQDDGVHLYADDHLREAARLVDGMPEAEGEDFHEEFMENLAGSQAHAAIAQALYARQALTDQRARDSRREPSLTVSTDPGQGAH